MRTLLNVCVLFATTVGVLLAAGPATKAKSEKIEFQVRKTDEGDLVEVKFSDVCFVTSELTFLHDDGSKTDVRVKNGIVELHGGAMNLTGAKIETVVPKGMVSRRSTGYAHVEGR